MSREHDFRTEKTWTHAFNLAGLHCGILLSIIVLAFLLTPREGDVNIRYVGLVVYFWLFSFFIYFRSFVPINKIELRFLSLKPISKSNIEILLKIHDRMLDGLRSSNKTIISVLALYALFLFISMGHIGIGSIVAVHMPILIVSIISVAHYTQMKVVTIPLINEYRVDESSMTTGSNLLSVYSMRFLVELLTPFILMIVGSYILTLLSLFLTEYSDDFNWLKRPWIFLFGFYIALNTTHALLSVCIPIFILMRVYQRIISLLVLFVSFYVCLTIGGYSINFFIPFLFSVLLSIYVSLSNMIIHRIPIILTQAVLSGLTSVVTLLLLNMSGIKLLFHTDIYSGLIIAVLLNHLISFFSPQKHLKKV